MSQTYDKNLNPRDPKNQPKNHSSHQAKNQILEEPKPIAIDGFQQVLEMLRIADPAFRESLLKRLAARDKDLVRSLRKDLENLDR